jgi:non-specific serine/threonine protein kinase/serine/threonine-protein kinase
MDEARWKKAKDIFAAALECDPGGRNALLCDACGPDLSLRLEIESLLSAYETSGRLSTPAWPDQLDRGTTVEGKAIGPYRLIRKIGEGGMGQVWLAEQTAPVRRQVALKLIRVGIYDDAVLKRFQAERQLLAMMDHPAIAKVFEAGATSDGQPFFVMEYVPGSPITDYCTEKKLSVRARLELFLAACVGVQHAHKKAIIHRDLKPANILVVEVDGKPMPRIIDFGLAKTTTPQLGRRATLTRLGSSLGTPGYMSPEQAEPSTRDVDSRTDVYSLGAVLYELLTGVLPFEPKPGRPITETLRQLREEDPLRPSTRNNALRGDLDAIVMKALERDLARRYGSPAELAEDIGRYLQNQPVMARPASRGYQLQKYVRRHRIGVAAAAVIVTLLASSVLMQAIELRRTMRERDRANRIADFMTTMFKIADRRENNVTAREILDRAAQDIETGLVEDPSLQAEMMDLMGTVYSSLGLVSRAQPLLEHAVGIRTRIEGVEDPDTLASRHNLADTLGRRGRYPEAEKLERETVEVSRRVLGPQNVGTLRSMASLAITLENEGRLPEAEQLNRDTIGLSRSALGEDNPDTLRAINSLGNVLQREGRYAEAERIHTDVVLRRRRVLGAEHPQTLISMQGLANDLPDQTKYAEAADNARVHRQSGQRSRAATEVRRGRAVGQASE